MTVDKELLKGCSKTLVLKLLSQKGMHGYEIAQELKAVTDGRIEITEGTMYPLLHSLEAGKAISSEWEVGGKRKRKVYRLTPVGRKLLKEKTQNWREFILAVDGVMAVKRLCEGVAL